MSRERELLQSVMEESWDFLYAGTHTEIKELLAQPEQKPEQTEQEPVAWMFGNKLYKKLYGKNHLSLEERNSFIPLYTAPPKREPLSEDKLDALAEANITDEGIAGYYLGFRDAEKAHGIGGGE